ncbi:MAG: alpha/beta hydrolase [Geminicoccaceae bacterium]
MRALVPWLAVLLAVCVPAAARAQFMGVYDYPFVSPLAATVAATPPANRALHLPTGELLRLADVRHVRPFPERPIPPVFWWLGDGMPYTLFKQPQAKAPLFFIIGGTGADHDSAKSYGMANVLYRAGFHVVTLPSPTHPSFIVTASSTSIPGQLELDAQDLYRAMDLIATQLAGEIDPTGYYLGGYSLGGTHAAFVSELDSRVRRFAFRRSVVINPAVSLYNSVNRLDQMVSHNLTRDPDAVGQFIDHLFQQVATLYSSTEQVGFSDPAFLYRVYATLEPPERELELLIGLAFRLTSNDMAFSSDVMTRSGYLVAKDAHLTSTSSLTDVLLVGLTLSFVNYFDGVYLPHALAREPGMTREALIERESLRRIEGYLRSDPNVILLGTQDDIILSREEVLWLADVFGKRARLFPTGGHCGSMDQREFVAEMLRLLPDARARS